MNVADYLYGRRARSLRAEDLADVLDSLVWVMDDNGAEVDEARRRWIDGDDPFAAEVALGMEEGLPFEPETMLAKLRLIEARWPHLRARCEVIRERLRTYGKGYSDSP